MRHWQSCFTLQHLDLLCIPNCFASINDLSSHESSMVSSPNIVNNQIDAVLHGTTESPNHNPRALSSALTLAVSNFKPYMQLLNVGKTCLVKLLREWSSVVVSSISFIKFLSSSSENFHHLPQGSELSSLHAERDLSYRIPPLSNSFCVVTLMSPFGLRTFRQSTNTTRTIVSLTGLARLQIAFWNCELTLQLEVTKHLQHLLSLSHTPISISSCRLEPVGSQSSKACATSSVNSNSNSITTVSAHLLVLPFPSVVSLIPPRAEAQTQVICIQQYF